MTNKKSYLKYVDVSFHLGFSVVCCRIIKCLPNLGGCRLLIVDITSYHPISHHIIPFLRVYYITYTYQKFPTLQNHHFFPRFCSLPNHFPFQKSSHPHVEQRRPGILLLGHLQGAVHQSCAQAAASVISIHCQAQDVKPRCTGRRKWGKTTVETQEKTMENRLKFAFLDGAPKMQKGG